MLFELISSTSTTQRECQPRGQCASSDAPDTLVVNAVFYFTIVIIHIHSLITLRLDRTDHDSLASVQRRVRSWTRSIYLKPVPRWGRSLPLD